MDEEGIPWRTMRRSQEMVMDEETRPLLARQSSSKVRLDGERRKLIVSCVLCGVFMVVELVGGYVAGSLAVRGF